MKKVEVPSREIGSIAFLITRRKLHPPPPNLSTQSLTTAKNAKNAKKAKTAEKPKNANNARNAKSAKNAKVQRK